uniref:His-Xaa-Ser system protein HxsD n=1 Tax=Vibrio parahaemolyticus TaxID=670 RepID=UPI0020C9D506|nr:His-Xaa-Ser system protein HxsD [Vibrio parahaemolyticus]
MLIHQLEKSTFSESVVRHALYWMSPLTTWKLADEDIRWTVHFSSQDEDIILEFERLLNDYLLREKLSKKPVVIWRVFPQLFLAPLRRSYRNERTPF